MRQGFGVCLIALAGLFPATVSAENESAWRTAIGSIAQEIRSVHPEPFARVGELEFWHEIDRFNADLPTLTDEQRIVRAMQIVALIGDGHTALEPASEAHALWYPIRIYQFSDGYFVTAAHRTVAELAGAQVLSIAGRPVEEVARAARTLFGADNEFGSAERLFAVHNAVLMKGLGYAEDDGTLRVRFRSSDGRILNHRLTPSRTDHERYNADGPAFEWQFRPEMFGLPFGADDDWISAYRGLTSSAFLQADYSRPAHLIRPWSYDLDGGRIAYAFPEQGSYYIRLLWVDDAGMVDFFRGALAESGRLGSRHLIIDIRGNSGGDGSRVADVVRELILARTESAPTIYLLVGRKTFSAAVMLADAIMDNFDVVTIGEPSGGAPNHYGDAVQRHFAELGLRLSVSTLRHQLSSSDDRSEFLRLDIPAPFSFRDYASGRDPAVDPILAGQDMRSVPQIALADGGAAARRVYLARKAAFERYEGWSLPSELSLRRICDELQKRGRMAEAVETCRLNTEVHPHVWNTWFNLGTAQRQAGLVRERFESWRCMQLVDPTNHNYVAVDEFLDDQGERIGSLPDNCPVRN